MCKIAILVKFGAHRMCARRQTKMSQYSNWLHSPTHFREPSVALLSRPNVHDLWRVRFRNFLSCGFYLGGLLIYLTSFLCFNYSTSWLLCQHFFEKCLGFLFPKHLSLTLRTQARNQLFSLGRCQVWHCVLNGFAILPSLILCKVYFNCVAFATKWTSNCNINSHNHYLSLIYYNYYNIKLIICQALFYNFFLVLLFLLNIK